MLFENLKRCVQRGSKISGLLDNGKHCCPKWFCCSTIRAGRYSEPLAERERYTNGVLDRDVSRDCGIQNVV